MLERIFMSNKLYKIAMGIITVAAVAILGYLGLMFYQRPSAGLVVAVICIILWTVFRLGKGDSDDEGEEEIE